MTPFGDAKNPARGLPGGLARVTAQAVTSSPVISAVRTVSPAATVLWSMFSQSNTSGMSI